ncbi:hypothetical protein EC957_006564 [Mortierella hygrophila]|uniref:BHLH domain-containing protein n=1 Tax=Mortierella hygrophila TaxID=979708 RepID=A0A9P6FIL9_9FUNG|nr:hypothetical protein EC957_006564 [Mortierella hygrophila]
MHPTAQSTSIPDLDMNPPPTWSKPTSALGLANPLHHLPQTQQVRQLQEQIQQHRRLQQQQSQSGYGLGEHVMRKKHSQGGSKPSSNQDRSFQQSFGASGGSNTTHQHINIKNTDEMNSDDDLDKDDDDEDDDDNVETSDDRQHSSSGMQSLHHHRTLSHPQLTQGFSIPIGFAGFTPSSPLSPSSPGSIASESASMTASMLSPGLLSPTSGIYSSGGSHGNHNPNSGGNNNNGGVHGIESSLASLASLSVMSSSSSVMPMSMPTSSRGRNTFSSPHHNSSQMATTPTTSSFQPQSLPVIYQNQPSAFHSSDSGHNNAGGFMPTSSAAAQSPSFNAFSSALTRVLPPRAPQTSAPRKYHGRQTRKVPTAPPVPKEVVDPTRRVAHIISEQKRREKINGGFDELKSVIPECAQNTDSKATILRKATDYILLLEEELRKYTDMYQLEAGDPESSLEGHERER